MDNDSSDRKRLEAMEMGIWRRMEKLVGWTKSVMKKLYKQ